ncbi:hypothetical protein GCM10007368_28780 [Isoptericola cucumis]|uniref:Uncharacterized protein n=1 Tax=Isoptericola cucumis TaxID=1776856 RepID=A0ABQ2B7Z7_9MICO|nr:hypothetical protein GCM10007368_28780 [Isoptericola cucumis]
MVQPPADDLAGTLFVPGRRSHAAGQAPGLVHHRAEDVDDDDGPAVLREWLHGRHRSRVPARKNAGLARAADLASGA